MQKGEILRNDGKKYMFVNYFVKVFKAFWYWYQTINRKKGKTIPDITMDLDSRGTKPKWVYLTEEQIAYCVDMVYPRLDAYSIHISNTQSFLQKEGEVFSNKLELLDYLYEKAVYSKTLANSLKTMVNNYNNHIAQQQTQSQIDQEAIDTILKILAMAI